MYSQFVSASLQNVLNKLDQADSEELLSVEQEIRLQQALIIQCKKVQEGTNDLHDLEKISKIISRLVTNKQVSLKLKIEQQRLIPVSDVTKFLDFLENLLVERVGEEQGNELINQFKNFKLSDYAIK